jgi:hypothetical protein
MERESKGKSLLMFENIHSFHLDCCPDQPCLSLVLYITPTTQTNICLKSPIDAISEGVHHLMVSSDNPAACLDPVEAQSSVDAITQAVHCLTVSSNDPPLHLDSVNADTALPPLVVVHDHPDDCSPAHDAPLPPRHPGMNKKDHRQYSTNALAVLELVCTELHNASNISHAPLHRVSRRPKW